MQFIIYGHCLFDNAGSFVLVPGLSSVDSLLSAGPLWYPKETVRRSSDSESSD